VVVSSNTRDLDRQMMEGGRSSAATSRHHSSTVRYMKLLEMVAGRTPPEIFAGMALRRTGPREGDRLRKDTEFRRERVGVFAMMHAMHAMIEDGLTIEEVTSPRPAMGRRNRPPSAPPISWASTRSSTSPTRVRKSQGRSDASVLPPPS